MTTWEVAIVVVLKGQEHHLTVEVVSLPHGILMASHKAVLNLDKTKKSRVVEVVGVVSGEGLLGPPETWLLALLLISHVVLGWLVTTRATTWVLGLVLVLAPVGVGALGATVRAVRRVARVSGVVVGVSSPNLVLLGLEVLLVLGLGDGNTSTGALTGSLLGARHLQNFKYESDPRNFRKEQR